MTATMGVRARSTQAIHGVNPVAKMFAAMIIGLCLILSIDAVSALVALLLEAVLLIWAGLSLRQFFLRTLPLWVAVPLTGITTTLYGVDSGMTLWEFGFVSVTEGSVQLGLAMMLRILAIGIPAIVLFVTTDPTDLADGLAQVLRLPERFVLGGLAGLRLVGLFIEDWRALSLARRARGVGDTGRIRRFGGQAFALLVLSVRRATKLATAMEAKGFDSDIRRTWARPSPFGWREVVLIVIAMLVGAAAVVAAVLAGTWRFILG